MREPRVKEIIENYEKGSVRQVYEYLSQPDMLVDINTWAGQIKKMIEEEQFFSVKLLIETTAYKFKNKKYEEK